MTQGSDALAGGGRQLILFVTGDAPRSCRARVNLASTLRKLGLEGTKLEEIDLVERPADTLVYGVFATPALLRCNDAGKGELLYGDLSERNRLERFLAGF